MQLRTTALIWLTLILLPYAVDAQTSSVPGPASEPPMANLSFEPVGPGDLLFVYVSNSVENTRSVRVSADGTIVLPSLKEPLKVTGLLSTEIEKLIVNALVTNKVLIEPAVSVSVMEYRSKPVNVVGAVHQPVTMQAIGHLHLLDAIAKAQGLAPEAGSQIIVSRPGENGGGDSVLYVPVKSLMDHSDASLNMELLGGEEIRVPPAGRFFVVGNVKNPGAYTINDGEGTTVLKALALCQGTNSFTQPEAFVYRPNPAGGARQEIRVPIRQIMKRQAPDFPLQANDIFYVADSTGKRMTVDVLDRIAGFGTATVSGVLVYKNR